MIEIALLFVLGAVIGSFLNVCIYRLPMEQSIVRGRSHCMNCGGELRPGDMVPIISYLLLRGRCRHCDAAFSLRYPLVELISGVVFVWTLLTVGLGPELIKGLIFASFLIVITFIDLDHQLIYDRVLLWLGGLGLLMYPLKYYFNDLLQLMGIPLAYVTLNISWLDPVLGFLAGGLPMLVIALLARGGMGGGDIKFAAAFGIWLGWKFTLLALVLSFFIGGTVSSLLLLLRIRGRKDMIPFGPFLALGAWLSFLYGGEILRWYFRGW